MYRRFQNERTVRAEFAKNVLIEYLEQIFKLEKSVLAQQNYMKKVNQLFHDVNNTKLYQEKKSIQSRKVVMG